MYYTAKAKKKVEIDGQRGFTAVTKKIIIYATSEEIAIKFMHQIMPKYKGFYSHKIKKIKRG